jgi:hypothetical protein
MKNILLIIAFLMISSNFLTGQTRVEGSIIVQFRDDSQTQRFIFDFASVDLKHNRVLSESQNIHLFTFDESFVNSKGLLDKVRVHTDVFLAQFDYVLEWNELIPNDTHFTEMWGLRNTGQAGGIIGEDIKVTQAWTHVYGEGNISNSREIVVAVLDDGFVLDHPDLRFHPLRWNTMSNSPNITAGSHGTHVSGTVGAIGNNATGVIGVAWDENFYVMPIQLSAALTTHAIVGYSWVLDRRLEWNNSGGAAGAYVVATNASFGIPRANPEDHPVWRTLYDTMGQAGILSAVANPNNASFNVDVDGNVPSGFDSPWMISVTNTDRHRIRHGAFGLNTIDLSATGTDILSTEMPSGYSLKTGTSMATPHVAGTIGLMYRAASEHLLTTWQTNPSQLALVFRQLIIDGVDPLPSLAGMTVTGGRLNALNSVLSVIEMSNAFGTAIHTSPSTLNFSDIYVGVTSVARTVIITNIGNELLSISSIFVSGTDQTQFNLIGAIDLPWTIEPMGTSSFTVSFTPVSAGIKTASISINHNATGSPHIVQLSGNGEIIAIPSIPYTENFNSGTSLSAIGWRGNPSQHTSIASGSGVNGTNGLISNVWGQNSNQTAFSPLIGPISPLSDLSFAYRIVGMTTNWSGTLIPTTLTTEDRVLIEVSATGPSGNFTPVYEINSTNHVVSTSFVTINQSLSSYACANIVFRFRVQRATGAWTLVVDDVSIINRAAPVWSIEPTVYNFGDVNVDYSSTAQSFTITNIGTENLVITSINLSGTDQTQFSLSGDYDLPWTIYPDGTRAFSVSFSPSSVGVKTVNVSISHNAIGSPSSVGLSGTGVTSEPALFFTLINDGTAYEVSRGTANSTHIGIPETHLGFPVIAIADDGFSDFMYMTSIEIPNSLTSIGSSAFMGCVGLMRIDISIEVITIGAGAFMDCSILTIYAAATNPEIDMTSPAHGWDANWNPDNRPVVWGDFVSESDDIVLIYPTTLMGNYPNPFNVETTIWFSVGEISTSSAKSVNIDTTGNGRLEIDTSLHVSISIYNIKGQQVRNLVFETFSAGTHSVIWDGRDVGGNIVSSGVYFYRMVVNDLTSVRMMILMK